MRRPHNTPLAEDKHGCYGANAPLRPNVTHSEGQHRPPRVHTAHAHSAHHPRSLKTNIVAMGRANAPVRPIVTHSEGRHTKAAPKGTVPPALALPNPNLNPTPTGRPSRPRTPASPRRRRRRSRRPLRLPRTRRRASARHGACGAGGHLLCACLCDGVLGAESRLR